jgi:AcrR family transcriptional regulator
MPRHADPERRATILRVARALFSQRGFDQTTMADIAVEAHMGVGSLYVYFPTKEAIGLTLVEEYFVALQRAVLPPLRQLHGAAAITEGLAAGFAGAAEHLDLIPLCRLIAPQRPLPERERFLSEIQAAVKHQIQQGYFRPLDPQFITEWLDDQIAWVINRCLLQQTGDIAVYQQQLIDVVIAAIVAPQEASPTSSAC